LRNYGKHGQRCSVKSQKQREIGAYQLPKEKDSQSLELEELIAIKRLLVFALLKFGATQKEVAASLGVAQSTISKMFPGGLPKQSKAATD
jgi:predicted XRE-type DNA-binding protein